MNFGFFKNFMWSHECFGIYKKIKEKLKSYWRVIRMRQRIEVVCVI
jgi:hypothetical protein